MHVSKRLLAVVALAIATFGFQGPAQGVDPVVIGYGMHTEGPTKVIATASGPLVVGPLSAEFSVTNASALCAVGEAGGQASPFNMLVYATDIANRTFGVQSGLRTMTLSGSARSITMVGSSILEDADTTFTATAIEGMIVDGVSTRGNFHITINTSLWPHQTFGKDLDGNPLPLFAGDVAFNRPIARALQ